MHRSERSETSKPNAVRQRMLLGGLLVGGLAVLGLGTAGAGTTNASNQAGVVHALSASNPVPITLPFATTTSTTTTVPPTTVLAAVPAPAPAAAIAAPAPTPVVDPAPAPEPAPVADPAPAPSGGSVEDAIATYFGDVYNQAIGVARCESGLQPDAVSAGGGNWGLFQINTVHRQRVIDMGYSWDQILDPYVNAAVARSIYDDAGGWGPWGCRGAAY